MEDKKCRICGFADLANTNIFQSNYKLVEKIVAVFPIILYPNDPLPKHICKKCLISSNSMYTEIERALKNQSRWIANVRSVQPDNHYVKVVDSVEGANKQTAQIISDLAGEELGERTVCHLFNFKTDDNNIPHKPQNNIRQDLIAIVDKPSPTPAPSPAPALSPAPAPARMEQDIELSATTIADQTSVPKHEQSVQTVLSNSPTKITHLKSVLELNGCTLTKLKPTIRAAPEPQPNEIDQIKVEIKEELLFHEEYSVCSVECKMCSFRCETVEELAIHQLDHLSLSVPKLSERRYLDKRIRRGRLIRVEEKKCIRCLNCWRIFVDNKSILHHWSSGDCDYFCQICGKEFASSPKMLREHVPAAHGISYKSSKMLRPHTLTPKPRIKNEKLKIEKSPQKSELSPHKGQKGSVSNEALSVKVACNICMKVFANFKARNSHMRAHKHPPLLPAQPPPSLSDTLLAFNRTNLLPVKDEPQDYDNIPYHIIGSLDTPAASTSKVVLPCAPNAALQPQLHPPSKIITHRPQNIGIRTSHPTGVRTKYVQIRPNPNSINFKIEPGLGSQVLKVKPLVDLQDPSVSSQQPEDSDKSCLRAINSAGPSGNNVPTSNGLGVATAPKDNMNYGQIFNCHPCGGKFSSKLELFRHKRKCTANNLFPCQFCSRHFLTSADLQMHIMLLHKNSCAQ